MRLCTKLHLAVHGRALGMCALSRHVLQLVACRPQCSPLVTWGVEAGVSLRPRVQVSARFLDAPQRSQKGGKVATGFAEHRTVSKQLLEQPQLCVPRKVIMDGNHNDKCLIRIPIMMYTDNDTDNYN